MFTDLVRHPAAGASGGSIFLLVKKDRGERHAKGLQSRPLESCFYTGEGGETCVPFYEFAQVQLTRLSRLRRSAYSLASACCAAQKDQSTPATTRLPSLQNLGYSVSVNDFTAVGAVGKSPAEAVLAAMKLPQKGGAWLSGGAVQSEHRRHATGRA